ncbi:MAG: HAMP domain-containing protein [Thiocapsa sp.]|uniref:sensor histidine kinase n=1 Tax=Thiocapsa sp. TaxID=2024551 RepID=UPI001BCB1B9C|nr:ATP-binding protein [Thiocapsa sp.]QVL49736.1 MAG: HAMP domain-containing protein [Thiocapsa sp.]
MTITAKIRIFQWAAVISLVLMAGVAGWTLMRSAADQRQIQTAYERYVDILTLSKLADRFSEQIAELMLLGEEAMSDYQSARIDLMEGLVRLETQMSRNATIAGNGPMAYCSLCDPRRLTDLRLLFHKIEATVDHIVLLQQQDRLPEAIELFRGEIEKGFDSEVELFLADARRDEQRELSETEHQAALMRQRVTVFFGAVAMFIILTTLITGVHIKRALVYPISRLIQGVQTIGQGNLDYRITNTGTDELSHVARQINEMAAQLKNQRDQLLNTHASLEGQVRQRTEELTRANQRLFDIDRQRLLFLADISHELRTPLTVLRGEAEIALRDERKSQQSYREALGLILRKGEEMSRLVDDLLFLARTEADAMRFDKQRTVLRDILESTLHEADILTRYQDIAIDATLPKDEILVEADPQRLKQALMVLIVNAIEHSDSGSHITIDASASEAGATVRVEDTGRGIPCEDLPYVFDRFYRGRNPDSAKRHTGSGLGLAIAKWIVEKHQGTLKLDSDTNGTVVTLSLPRLVR